VIKNNKFRIIFSDQENNNFDLEYRLHDSSLAQKWAKKIKHLKNIPIDPIESDGIDVSNINKIYNEFCEFASLQPIDISNLDQNKLNALHKIYEETHEKLSRVSNNSILYKFHHSIHYNESKGAKDKIYVGWGVKEGLLTEQFDCYSYYADEIKANNLYLSWAELGKKPLDYWRNKEPDNQQRVNELCKPHSTLRAKFFVSLKDKVPGKFTADFLEWFDVYKKAWLETYNLKSYDEIHYYSAPLLAHADHKQDLTNAEFVKILI